MLKSLANIQLSVCLECSSNLLIFNLVFNNHINVYMECPTDWLTTNLVFTRMSESLGWLSSKLVSSWNIQMINVIYIIINLILLMYILVI